MPAVQAMQVKATALIPFIPAGGDFEVALAFFAELGFEAAWQQGGLAGLNFRQSGPPPRP